jgi:hypothetical protein
MSIRDAFIASLFGIFGFTSHACANSCANVDVMGSFDESGLKESDFGIYSAGTFRVAEEDDEGKQPMFNLTTINCTKQLDDSDKASFECNVTRSVVWSQSGKPDVDEPNCSLDLESSSYSMRELQKGILVGIETSTSACYNSELTIDRNTKRVYMSLTRTKDADNYDKTRPGTCGAPPSTQVLMNCTGWPRIRKHGQTPPRYCDFSSSSDK